MSGKLAKELATKAHVQLVFADTKEKEIAIIADAIVEGILKAHKQVNNLLTHSLTMEERRALHNAQVVIAALLEEI